MPKSFSKLLQFTALVGLIICSCPALAQTTQSVDEPLQLLNDYNSRFPLEKVYLHTDRKHYAPGESVWFQAYVVAGYFHEPSPLSNNLYVSLYKADKSLIEQQLIRVDVGAGHGVIDLPDSLEAGSYVLRAYTNWMRNFDEAFFFEKELVVLGTEAQSLEETRAEKIDLQFFPEGGMLVDQIATRVAFKAINEQGLPVSVNGVIYDNENTEVARFETQHEGMGLLVFTPQKGQNYRAEVNGQSYPLPAVDAQGFGIAANNQMKDILRLTIRSNEATRRKDQLGLLVHARGAVSFAFDVDISEDIAFFNLPKAELPAGINHITLFDGKGNALVERLVFIEPKGEQLSFSTDKETYGKREKVTAKLELKDTNGEPLSGVFSLAAIDLGQSAEKEPKETILSNLLLSSDLKGYITNPMYYFDPANQNAKEHLDLVMMTHGWTRFSWASLPERVQSTATYPVEQGLDISGKLLRLGSKKVAAKGMITLINQQTVPPLFTTVEADSEGNFLFDNVLVFDDQELVFQGLNKKGKPLVDLSIDQPEPELALSQFKTSIQESRLKDHEAKLLAEQKAYRDQLDEVYAFDSTARILETVVVEAEREGDEVIDPDIQIVNVYGKPDDTYKVGEDEVIVSGNALEMIAGKLGGVNVGGFGLNTTVTIRVTNAPDVPQPEPLILIDNVPTDVSAVLQLSAQMVERVEVYKGPRTALFGLRGEHGVLAFFTKKVINWKVDRPAVGVLTTLLENSYRQPRAFYAPKYEVEKPEHIKPDSRVVLLWKPLILLDEHGRAEIEFWNSDDAKEVLLDLQGITMDGSPLATTIQYTTADKE